MMVNVILAFNLNEFLQKPLTVQVLVPALKIVVVMVLAVVIRGVVRRLINKKLATDTDKATELAFFRHFFNGLLYFIAGLAIIGSIPALKDVTLSIFAGSGIVALIIGFASQQAFSNIISGIFITLFKPFRVGDRVSFIGKDCMGIVEDITFRHTVIRTFENSRIIIPNSVINVEMIENSNLIDEKYCNIMEFGISYDSDINKAMDIIRGEIKKHPLYLDNRTEEEKMNNTEPVPVRLTGFGDSAVILKAWAWSFSPGDAFLMKCDINKAVKERFDKEGIEIPFPYRTIVYKNKD